VTAQVKRPEVLAPAGDRACLEAAITAGADAVYFGLSEFNARARATNFALADLDSVMHDLHRYGSKGYVTLNTVLFDDELARMRATIEACANAGADAVIVQDLGVASMVREIAPHLHLHASTQMTCTDAAACNFAASLGVKRVILARELSIEEIRAIHAATTVELEAFVHGALCIAYSGQCLTSEAVGGRSANRGACAQACRLPYELVVDGEVRDLGNRQYLLSPQDLESSHLVGALADAGICSLKIEGRLKGVDYVRATVRLYREAIDAWMQKLAQPSPTRKEQALQAFSRSSSSGFFQGVDHQALVPADSSDHRGVDVGTVEEVLSIRGRDEIVVRPTRALSKGDGLLIQGSRGIAGELGGRIWEIHDNKGAQIERAEPGTVAQLWLGPGKAPNASHRGRALFRTNDPSLSKVLEREHAYTVPLHIVVSGALGEPLIVHATSVRGHVATVQSQTALEAAQRTGLDETKLRERLGKLGETPFVLGQLESKLVGDLFLPPSVLNELRRAMVATLEQSLTARTSVTSIPTPAPTERALRAPLKAGLFVLCRNAAQANAALLAGADGVGLDFLELTGTGDCFRALRKAYPDRELRLAPPRVRKPKEEKIDAFLHALEPNAMMVRGLGALGELAHDRALHTIGDFSLNVTNAVTAMLVLRQGLDCFTPAFDLDEKQLLALMDHRDLAERAEVVVHHPMPLFYMEHCVFAAVMSKGADYRTCGRPCDRHVVSLKDRAGFEHPLQADVSCRNTVFHAKPQSAAHIVPSLTAMGVSRFRIEAVRETAEEIATLVHSYKALVAGTLAPTEALARLKSQAGYGVVRGSLRVLS
jgi:U32 family peptidase